MKLWEALLVLPTCILCGRLWMWPRDRAGSLGDCSCVAHFASHAVERECDPETEQWSCGKPFLCHLLPLHAGLQSQRLIVLTWCYWLALHVVDWPWLNRQSSEVWETFLVLPAGITCCGPRGKAAEEWFWCKLQAVLVVDWPWLNRQRSEAWETVLMLYASITCGRPGDRAVRSEEWFWCCVIELCAVGCAGPRDRAMRYLLASHVIDLETEQWGQRNGFGVK